MDKWMNKHESGRKVKSFENSFCIFVIEIVE